MFTIVKIRYPVLRRLALPGVPETLEQLFRILGIGRVLQTKPSGF